ncbi:hypothetical protein ACOMHN_065263 [Nucella lapillus]
MSGAVDFDSLDKQEKPMRKRRRVLGEKVCQVCGDKALAHHFGALACETCKAFFRRNALAKEQRKCLFKGDCPIDVKTRRFCPACRLVKCFSVGMQADNILDDEEKRQRIQKMSKKKCKKEQQQSPQQFCPEPGGSRSSMPQSLSPMCAVTTTDREVSCNPDQLHPSMMEQAWLAATTSSTDSRTGDLQGLGAVAGDSLWGQEGVEGGGQSVEVLLAQSEGLMMGAESKHSIWSGRESVIHQPASDLSCPPASLPHSPCGPFYAPDSGPNTAPATELIPGPSACQMALSTFTTSFKHVSREDLPSDPYMYWRLSEEERSLLTQLSAAYQDTVLTVLQGKPPRENIHGLTHEIYLHECEREASQAVSFAKRMEDFRQLRLDEQIALLKASTCQVLGIRSCALYIAEKDAWLTSEGYFTLTECLQLFPDHPQTTAFVNFCRIIKSIVKNDVTLYALLHCLVLFDPSDERIIDRQLINSIRDKYIILLRHYLESLYSYLHSDRYMMALQENIIWHRSLCLEGKPLIKKFFPSIPNKLLIEVLDLD